MARTKLEHRGLPTKLCWAKVVAIDVHIFSKSPTASVLGETLYEAYFGRKPMPFIFVFSDVMPMHMCRRARGR